VTCQSLSRTFLQEKPLLGVKFSGVRSRRFFCVILSFPHPPPPGIWTYFELPLILGQAEGTSKFISWFVCQFFLLPAPRWFWRLTDHPPSYEVHPFWSCAGRPSKLADFSSPSSILHWVRVFFSFLPRPKVPSFFCRTPL